MKGILLALLITGSLFSLNIQAKVPVNLQKECTYMVDFFVGFPKGFKSEDQFVIGWQGNESPSEKQTWLTAKHMLFLGEDEKTVMEWCMGKQVKDYPTAWE